MYFQSDAELPERKAVGTVILDLAGCSKLDTVSVRYHTLANYLGYFFHGFVLIRRRLHNLSTPTPISAGAIEKLIEPIGSSLSEKPDRVVTHLWLIDVESRFLMT